jgi:hypothetical protein
MLLNGAAQTEETALSSSICAAPFSNMRSTQADNSSRKLRLRWGCQFPWYAAEDRFAQNRAVSGSRFVLMRKP